MKKQFRLGFTLVELLVVISIIGMLAGLLLPAVNAAREAGRKAVCMNNQSQLALAVINYDSARGCVPPMRGEVGRRVLTAGAEPTVHYTSWIGFLLPYMEYSQLYQNLTGVLVNSTNGDRFYHESQLIRIKPLLCPSANVPIEDSGMHYVCNGGYQNCRASSGTGWESNNPNRVQASSTWPNRPWDPGKVADAVFFDHLAGTRAYDSTTGNEYECKTKCSIDYISSHNGTSNTLLLSENVNAGRWSRWDTTDNVVTADGEDLVAFCYPWNTNFSGFGTGATETSNPATLRMAEFGTESKWSYMGYLSAPSAADPYGTTTDQTFAAFFINIAKGDEYSSAYGTTYRYRRARPSSNHPGIVLAAFADRSVRPLNENMNKQTFVWICSPDSGRVIKGDSF